jgi:hypothetical protein
MKSLLSALGDATGGAPHSLLVKLIYQAYIVSYMTKPLIRVSEENKKRLAKFGDASETIDDCLDRVLTLAEAMRDGGAR